MHQECQLTRVTVKRLTRMRRTAHLATFLTLCVPILRAQNPQLETKNGARFPTVVFTSVLWTANPPYYSIAIDSTGAATYQSAPDSVTGTGVPYSVVFQSTDATRRTTFNITRSLDLFRGEFPVTVASPAEHPVHTLTYHDTTYNNQITYSDSTDTQIQELTSIFEEVSTTFEFARRLAYFHQHDKTALDGELTRMQTDAQRHFLRELQTVTAVLKSIASDKSVSDGAREKANAILHLMRRS
jgi:hypothetical protein